MSHRARSEGRGAATGGTRLELEEAGEGEHVEGDEVGLGAEVLRLGVRGRRRHWRSPARHQRSAAHVST